MFWEGRGWMENHSLQVLNTALVCMYMYMYVMVNFIIILFCVPFSLPPFLPPSLSPSLPPSHSHPTSAYCPLHRVVGCVLFQIVLNSIKKQSGLSELSVISWVYAVEGGLLGGALLYWIHSEPARVSSAKECRTDIRFMVNRS